MFRLLGSDRVRYIRVAEERAAFLFSWNPENWSLENFLALRQRWLNNPDATEMWSSGNTTSIPKRARVFIIKQGPDLPRGIVGSGWTDSDWYPKDGQNWNDLKFEILLNPQVDGLLTTDKLLDLSTTRWSVPASGISLSSDIAGPLEDRWAGYLSRIDRPTRPVEESDAAAGSSLEGDRVLRSHLAAERDPELPRIKRALVLQQTGRLACEVCDFDFAETWGEVGEGRSRSQLQDDTTPLRSLYLGGNDLAIYTALRNWFDVAKAELWHDLPTDSYIRKNVGIQSLFDVLRAVLADFRNDKKISISFFKAKLEPAKRINFSDGFFQASGKGRIRIKNSMLLAMGLVELADLPSSDQQGYRQITRH